MFRRLWRRRSSASPRSTGATSPDRHPAGTVRPRLHGSPPPDPPGLRIDRSSVAMGDESEPIFLDVDTDHLTAGTVLTSLTDHYSNGRLGWVFAGSGSTTWVLWDYPEGRWGPSRALAVLTCDPVTVTHRLVPDETALNPAGARYLRYHNAEDPEVVAAAARAAGVRPGPAAS